MVNNAQDVTIILFASEIRKRRFCVTRWQFCLYYLGWYKLKWMWIKLRNLKYHVWWWERL